MINWQIYSLSKGDATGIIPLPLFHRAHPFYQYYFLESKEEASSI